METRVDSPPSQGSMALGLPQHKYGMPGGPADNWHTLPGETAICTSLCVPVDAVSWNGRVNSKRRPGPQSLRRTCVAVSQGE